MERKTRVNPRVGDTPARIAFHVPLLLSRTTQLEWGVGSKQGADRRVRPVFVRTGFGCPAAIHDAAVAVFFYPAALRSIFGLSFFSFPIVGARGRAQLSPLKTANTYSLFRFIRTPHLEYFHCTFLVTVRAAARAIILTIFAIRVHPISGIMAAEGL